MDDRLLWALFGAALAVIVRTLADRSRPEREDAAMLSLARDLTRTTLENMQTAPRMTAMESSLGDIAHILKGLNVSVSNLVLTQQRGVPMPSALQHGQGTGPVVPPIPPKPSTNPVFEPAPNRTVSAPSGTPM